MKLRNVAFSIFVMLYAYTADPLIDLLKWFYELSWEYPRQANGILFISASSVLLWLCRDVSVFSWRDGAILFWLAALMCLRGLELLVVRRQSPRRTKRELKEV